MQMQALEMVQDILRRSGRPRIHVGSGVIGRNLRTGSRGVHKATRVTIIELIAIPCRLDGSLQSFLKKLFLETSLSFRTNKVTSVDGQRCQSSSRESGYRVEPKVDLMQERWGDQLRSSERLQS